jgi:hypothetical protein
LHFARGNRICSSRSNFVFFFSSAANLLDRRRVVTQTQRERGGKTNGTASFAPTKGTQKKTKKKRNERDLIRKTHGRLAFKTLGIHCALKKNKIKKEMRKRERERVDWPKKLVTGPAAL